MAFLNSIKSVEAFQALPRAARNLVFYSEGPQYWPHFQPILRNVLEAHNHPAIYLASSMDDPGLRINSPLLKSFCIGDGGARNELFRTLNADVMVMTTPDLETLYLKRSKHCGHYAYIFHSPVSTHMIYQPAAFDNYDSIFCVGPHHETEIRKREALTGAKPKILFRHGYSRLDGILESAPEAAVVAKTETPHVLVAPSWGPNGIFETFGAELIETLLDAGFIVTARPHPQTQRLNAPEIKRLESLFGDSNRFVLERNVASSDSLFKSHVMISDWSGAAFDYAFGLLKPVLFIDTPRKVNNPDYEQLQIEPLEAVIRDSIGRVINPQKLAAAPEAILELAHRQEQWREKILTEREKWIYNIGASGLCAAAGLVNLANKLNLGEDADEELCAVKQIAMKFPRDALGDGEGDVASYTLNLLNSETPFTAIQLDRLEAMCRRIDVYKKLSVEYDACFSKPLNKNPVNPAALALLAYVLTSAARQTAAENLGRALKFLNAAGNALNLFKNQGGVFGAPQIESHVIRTYQQLGVGS